ncbi:hypothetical protein, partial [Pluralibacter gergoviae]|uniref:hypothetical protein n=1 Tax=Pluralibacter gergoviae TaxID=61647 RepID=UPI001E5499EB
AVYTLSRRAPSATRTPHHIVFPVVTGTGANVGKTRTGVNQLFAKIARLAKLPPNCAGNNHYSLFLSSAYPRRAEEICYADKPHNNEKDTEQ